MLVSPTAKLWGKPAGLGALTLLGLRGLREGNSALLTRHAQLHRVAAMKEQNRQRTNGVRAVLQGFAARASVIPAFCLAHGQCAGSEKERSLSK